MIQTIKDLVSAKADTTVALAKGDLGLRRAFLRGNQVRRCPHRRPEAGGLYH